jgi:hypothetical protein
VSSTRCRGDLNGVTYNEGIGLTWAQFRCTASYPPAPPRFDGEFKNGDTIKVVTLSLLFVSRTTVTFFLQLGMQEVNASWTFSLGLGLHQFRLDISNVRLSP